MNYCIRKLSIFDNCCLNVVVVFALVMSSGSRYNRAIGVLVACEHPTGSQVSKTHWIQALFDVLV